jgi:P-type Cu+ transporter
MIQFQDQTGASGTDRVRAGRASSIVSSTGPAEASSSRDCFHCGTPCGTGGIDSNGQSFCCRGCLTVFELLTENGLADFYRFGQAAGVRVESPAREAEFQYLNEPEVRDRLVDFLDERITRVTFRVPAIHCAACVWLLENLFRLKPGIGVSRVNFPKKEVSITFENARVTLPEAAALLSSLGYAPELKLADLDARPSHSAARRLYLQIGVAGFAFGNIMLFSIASYLGLDSANDPGFQKLFGVLSLLLALPVIFYSAADYGRALLLSFRQRRLTLDVPIALGISALAAQSAFEVLTGRGQGYFDSLTGLVFFLLCGKLFQQKTYDRLAFDRDYKSFFPLSVTRVGGRAESRVSLSQLRVGDRLILRNRELIPADARLRDGPALVDYSFVTGESEPVGKRPGDYLYAGGRQQGGAIEVETVKPVSQSYLTSLWNQEAFRKEKDQTLNTLTNRYSRYFTQVVVAIAVGAGVFWWFWDSSRWLNAFTSVLIVACPCALALAAPFALGTAQRLLGRRNVFLKNPHVLETLAGAQAVVFDKTGTLTVPEAASVTFDGTPLTPEEERWLFSLTRHSTHPYALRIGNALGRDHFPEPVGSFLESAGQGLEGRVAGHEIWMGSAVWLSSRHVVIPAAVAGDGGTVHVALDGVYRGSFRFQSALLPGANRLLRRLARRRELALLSGDNEKDQGRFRELFGPSAQLRFHQSPLDKLDFIRQLQRRGRTVIMVGDGLNDAGALRQSDAGLAVVESISAFAPASDVIMTAAMVPRLPEVLSLARNAVRVVQGCILLSALYNVAGISIAALGLLSPVVCAILMPLSSVTVVACACGLTAWRGRRLGLAEPAGAEGQP